MHGTLIKQEKPKKKNIVPFILPQAPSSTEKKEEGTMFFNIFPLRLKHWINPASVLWHSAAAPVVLGRILLARGDATDDSFSRAQCDAIC
jgi:hypothetical protein